MTMVLKGEIYLATNENTIDFQEVTAVEVTAVAEALGSLNVQC